MLNRDACVRVEVVYALKNAAHIIPVELAPGATIKEAIESSGILQKHPDIDLDVNKCGIFGKIRKLDDEIRAGDRVEIYRPLLADPKQARRNRAAKQKQGKSAPSAK